MIMHMELFPVRLGFNPARVSKSGHDPLASTEFGDSVNVEKQYYML